MGAGFYVFVLGAAGIVALILWVIFRDRSQYRVPMPFSTEWRELLETHVRFYQNLNQPDRKRFEKKIRHFLKKVRITGIRVEVTDLDRLLTASSAVIPLFNFPKWSYNHLHEVLLYPAYFDSNFSTEDPEEVISGLVGSGRNLDGVMILNKQSLHNGYANNSDKRNVGIHEFTHILDKEDGDIDGVPLALNENSKPWLKLMHRNMRKIKQGKSDIDEYAATGEEEFLAVASEYFFERPNLFKTKHPDLYKTLKKVYHIDMARRLKNSFKKKKRVGRNDPCPCGSGEKFKNCCL